MGTVPIHLATELRDALGLERVIETGTYRGGSARLLAEVFPSVTTIELSEELAREARTSLAGVPAVTVVQGDSRGALPGRMDANRPTLYWLDGHWSGGPTAGADDECPLLDELNIIKLGHADDVVLIDDARLFIAAPPPPHDPAQWPTLVEVFDAVREVRRDTHVTVFADMIVAAPQRAKPIVDRHARDLLVPEDVRTVAGPDRAGALGHRARQLLSFSFRR